MKLILTIIVLVKVTSCKSLNEIEQLPKGQYHISTNDVKKIDPSYQGKIKVKILAKNDSTILSYNDPSKKSVSIDSIIHYDLLLRQRKIDLDIFTIPFKIRFSANDFPP